MCTCVLHSKGFYYLIVYYQSIRIKQMCIFSRRINRMIRKKKIDWRLFFPSWAYSVYDMKSGMNCSSGSSVYIFAHKTRQHSSQLEWIRCVKALDRNIFMLTICLIFQVGETAASVVSTVAVVSRTTQCQRGGEATSHSPLLAAQVIILTFTRLTESESPLKVKWTLWASWDEQGSKCKIQSWHPGGPLSLSSTAFIGVLAGESVPTHRPSHITDAGELVRGGGGDISVNRCNSLSPLCLPSAPLLSSSNISQGPHGNSQPGTGGRGRGGGEARKMKGWELRHSF